MKSLGIKNYALIVFIYTVFQGIGMAIMHYGFNVAYGQGEGFVYAVLVTEIIVAISVFFFVTRYASWREVGYGKISWVNTLWVLPFLIASGVITIAILRAVLQPGVGSAAILGVMAAALLAILVGFCEETVFRGIVLRGALLRHGVIVAMVISAIAFMLLHVVNVLGGNPLSDMPSHLSSQIWYGLLMAPLALKIRNLTPLIIVHAMWDFTSLASNFVDIADGGLVGIAFAVGPILQYGIMLAILVVIFIQRNSYSNSSKEIPAL